MFLFPVASFPSFYSTVSSYFSPTVVLSLCVRMGASQPANQPTLNHITVGTVCDVKGDASGAASLSGIDCNSFAHPPPSAFTEAALINVQSDGGHRHQSCLGPPQLKAWC